jgi:hypothetical protein
MVITINFIQVAMWYINNNLTVAGGGEPVRLDGIQQRVLEILGEDNASIVGCSGGIDSGLPADLFSSQMTLSQQAGTSSQEVEAVLTTFVVPSPSSVVPSSSSVVPPPSSVVPPPSSVVPPPSAREGKGV